LALEGQSTSQELREQMAAVQHLQQFRRQAGASAAAIVQTALRAGQVVAPVTGQLVALELPIRAAMVGTVGQTQDLSAVVVVEAHHPWARRDGQREPATVVLAYPPQSQAHLSTEVAAVAVAHLVVALVLERLGGGTVLLVVLALLELRTLAAVVVEAVTVMVVPLAPVSSSCRYLRQIPRPSPLA
jgi:hypothetical protein